MAPEILFFVIFGILSCTNAKPDHVHNSYQSEAEHDLKKLVELFKRGNENNIMLNHHEDRPGTHHEDTVQLIYQSGKPNPHNHINKHHDDDLLKKILHHNSINNLNLFFKKKPETKEDVKKIARFRNLNGDYNIDNRDQGEGDNRNRNYDHDFINENYDGRTRCNSKACRGRNDRGDNDRDDINRDDKDREDDDRDDNYRESLRNYENGDTQDIMLNIQRCVGDRCSRIIDYGNDNLGDLYCSGESCSRNKNNARDDSNRQRDDRDFDNNERLYPRDEKNYVRDNKHRHKNYRQYDRVERYDDRNDRYYDRDDRYDDRNDRTDRDNYLRCKKGRCGRDDD